MQLSKKSYIKKKANKKEASHWEGKNFCNCRTRNIRKWFGMKLYGKSELIEEEEDMEKDIEELREKRELDFFIKNLGSIPRELINYSSGLTYPNQTKCSELEEKKIFGMKEEIKESETIVDLTHPIEDLDY